jgi:hypothetical protein
MYQFKLFLIRIIISLLITFIWIVFTTGFDQDILILGFIGIILVLIFYNTAAQYKIAEYIYFNVLRGSK